MTPEILWIGHAGVLIRHGKTVIAVDPFISGHFDWEGHIEKYQGQSPWIGSPEKENAFLQTYGKQITAVCITHVHGDHFNRSTIVKLLQLNPKLTIIAPRRVIRQLRTLRQGKLHPIQRNRTYSVGEMESLVQITGMAEKNLPLEIFPRRVGYFLVPFENNMMKSTKNLSGIFYAGDAHHVGDWNSIRKSVRDIILWPENNRQKYIEFFNSNGTLKRVWWTHWESFVPGQFFCNQSLIPLEQELKEKKLGGGQLSYTQWIPIPP